MSDTPMTTPSDVFELNGDRYRLILDGQGIATGVEVNYSHQDDEWHRVGEQGIFWLVARLALRTRRRNHQMEEAVVVIDQWEGRILASLGYASRAEAPIPLGSSVSDWAAEQVASLRNRRTPPMPDDISALRSKVSGVVDLFDPELPMSASARLSAVYLALIDALDA